MYCALLVEGDGKEWGGKEWGGVATRVGRQDDRGGAVDMMRHDVMRLAFELASLA